MREIDFNEIDEFDFSERHKEIQGILKEMAENEQKVLEMNDCDEKGRLYSQLVLYSLFLDDIQAAITYAQKAENLGDGIVAWNFYGSFFKNAYTCNIIIENFDARKETIRGYGNIAKYDRGLGFNLLADFFELIGETEKAIEYRDKSIKTLENQGNYRLRQ